MKRRLQLICLIFVILLFLASIRLFTLLPADTQPYIEKKYAGWNGVIEAWVCADWEPAGSFIRWLNTSASSFEKKHDGIYIEFTPVSRETLNALQENDSILPEIIFFSPSQLNDRNLLMNIDTPSELRADLAACGCGYAIPVAMGGYIWTYNRMLCDASSMLADASSHMIFSDDEAGYARNAAMIGLLSDFAETSDKTAPEISIPNSSLDLGLPASVSTHDFHYDDAMNLFMNGELPFLPVSQHEIARLIKLRDSGRGPDWLLYASGNIACTDQLLFAGLIRQTGRDDQTSAAQLFLSHLFSEEAQSALSDAGIFSVTGQTIYSGFSEYAPLDELLNNRTLCVPKAFPEYSMGNSAAIVHDFFEGKFTAKDALIQLGFESM